MRVDIIESYEELLGLRANWEAVYERDPDAHFFLSWIWLSQWLKDDDGWLILAASPADGQDYVAFFPLRLRTKMRRKRGYFYNEITLAGRGLSDYTGLIALPEHEARAIDAFGHHLRQQHWAVFELEFVRASPHRIKRLLHHFPERSFRVTNIGAINKDNIDLCICPFVELPDDWEAYLATLGSNTRQKIRRFLRKVETSDEFRITVADASTVERDVDILLDFWRIKWAPRKGDRVPTLLKTNRRMLLACFETDTLFMPVMWQGETPLAALGIFVDRLKHALLFFVAGRNEAVHSALPPGFVLHAYSIRHAIKHGFRTYDFLRGNEEYKYLFGAKEFLLHNLVITTPNHQNLGGKLDPQSVPKVLAKALQLHKAGKLDEAEHGYRQVLDATPKSATALYGYGQLLEKRGDHQGAARLFRKVVAVKPDARSAWLRLGIAFEGARRFADAAKAYQEIIRQHPSDSEAYMQLGRALLAQGKGEEAGSAFKTAASLRGEGLSGLH